jgi:hypothetical protein
MRISVIRIMTRIGHRGGRDCVRGGQEERGRSYCSSSLKIEKKKSKIRAGRNPGVCFLCQKFSGNF